MKFTKKLITAATLFCILLGVSAISHAKPTLRFGWTAWADAEFVTKLAKQTIEDHWDVNVELPMSAIALQYEGVAKGDIDGMLMAWLPDSQADYWSRYKKDLVDLGTLYDSARLGWAVPDYIPKDKLDSIKDLKKPEVQSKLSGTIQGIDPGAGISRLSKNALKDYQLKNYQLQTSSESGMLSALDRAIKHKKWVVVTAWTPHWMFGRWNLRFLDDPKSSLGDPQHVDILVRQGFKKDYPEISQYLENMYIPLDKLQHYMDIAEDKDYPTAVNTFIKNEKGLIHKWLEK